MKITIVDKLENAEKAWPEVEAEQAFWRAHWQELLEKYPDQFVVVQDQKVIATGESLDDVLDDLERRSIEPTHVGIKYILTNPKSLLPRTSSRRSTRCSRTTVGGSFWMVRSGSPNSRPRIRRSLRFSGGMCSGTFA